MSQHTPGPWLIHSTGDVVAWRADRLVFVASVGQETREANARLIAAAPDLLAALDQLSDVARCFGVPDNSPALQRASSAIGAARGLEDS